MLKRFLASVSALALCSTAALAGTGYRSPVSIPEQIISDLGNDLALEDFQAAGVAGNLAQETGNFRYLQELNPLVEGHVAGSGTASGPRHAVTISWASRMDGTF